MVTIKPGGLREMHWHLNADEWRAGRGPQAITTNFHAGDMGYIKKAFGHYLENTGNTDLVYMEVFRADRFEEVPVTIMVQDFSSSPVCRSFHSPQSAAAGSRKHEGKNSHSPLAEFGTN
jgi:hypothetical protein